MRPKEGRVKELPQERGLGKVTVSSPENFYYATDFGGHQHTISRQSSFMLAIMHSDDKAPTCITTVDFETATFRIKSTGLDFVVDPYGTWVGLRAWLEISQGAMLPNKTRMGSSAGKPEQFIKTCNLADKRIDVEVGYLTVLYYDMTREKFLKARLVDISDLFMYAGSIKTEEEIKMSRGLCHITDHGFTQVSKTAEIEAPEKEMSDCFREDVIQFGFCVPSTWSMFFTGPFDTRLTLPKDGVVKGGGVARSDAEVNAEFDFYTTDTSRAWIIGGGDPALMKLKDGLYGGQRRMIATTRPGPPMDELCHATYSYVEGTLPYYKRGYQDHSISMGSTTAEASYIDAAETRPLEAGMVLVMEVPCYIGGVNGFNTRDMTLVTENGCKVLAPYTPHYL